VIQISQGHTTLSEAAEWALSKNKWLSIR